MLLFQRQRKLFIYKALISRKLQTGAKSLILQSKLVILHLTVLRLKVLNQITT